MKSDYMQEIVVTGSALAGAFVLYHLLFYLLNRWAEKKKRYLPSALKQELYYPGLLVMIAISIWITLGIAAREIEKSTFLLLRHGLTIYWIACSGFLISRLIAFFGKITLRGFATEQLVDYSHRKARTKFELIQRILNVLIFIGALALILMTFKSVRQVGSTLLASAGVLGLIIGFAAQKSLGALFAGVQIAIAQPVRIGDTVVVEGHYGTIGEITLTYIVLNTWDGRRLVIPIHFFLEKSFENWTRRSPDIIGKVTLHADYSLPVEKVRNEFMRLVSESKLWDGRTCGLVVLSATDRTIELRGIMSARNSGDAFELECFLREQLIGYIRNHYPECLPKQRMEQIGEA